MKRILLCLADGDKKIAILDGENREVIRNLIPEGLDGKFEEIQEQPEISESFTELFQQMGIMPITGGVDNLLETLLDKLDNKVQEIIVQGENSYNTVIDYLSKYAPHYVSLVKEYNEHTDLFEKFGIDDTKHLAFGDHSAFFDKMSDDFVNGHSVTSKSSSYRTFTSDKESSDSITDTQRLMGHHVKASQSLPQYARERQSPIKKGSGQNPMKLVLIVVGFVVGIAAATYYVG